MPTAPREVMRLWQAQHGNLGSAKLMRQFLARTEAREISHYPEEWIVDALSQEKLLEHSLLILDWRSAIEARASVKQESIVSDASSRASRSHGLGPRPELSFKTIKNVELDVVGESFYAENFDSVREKLRNDYKSHSESKLELVLDPANPFSSSGKAVMVNYEELTLGYVPERIAPSIYRIVERLKGRVSVEAVIWFAARQDQGRRNSVRIKGQRPSSKKIENRAQPGPRPSSSSRSQSELDAEAWVRRHGRSSLSPGYVEGAESKNSGRRPAKKLRTSSTPVKMSFYCEKCAENAGSRSRPCISCASLRGIPRNAAKTLQASKGKMLENRAHARRAKRTKKPSEGAEG